MLKIQDIRNFELKRCKAKSPSQQFHDHTLMMKTSSRDTSSNFKNSVMKIYHTGITYTDNDRNLLSLIPEVRINNRYAEIDGYFFYTKVPKPNAGCKIYNNFVTNIDYKALAKIPDIKLSFGQNEGDFDENTVRSVYESQYSNIDTLILSIPINGCIIEIKTTPGTTGVNPIDTSIVYVLSTELEKQRTHSMFSRTGSTEISWKSSKIMNMIVRADTKGLKEYSFSIDYKNAVRDTARQNEKNDDGVGTDAVTIRTFHVDVTVTPEGITTKQFIMNTDKVEGNFNNDYCKPVSKIYDRAVLDDCIFDTIEKPRKVNNGIWVNDKRNSYNNQKPTSNQNNRPKR